MILTTPRPDDIPTGPERPGPAPSTGELEGLKKTVQELLVHVNDLEARVSRLEESVRNRLISECTPRRAEPSM